jgi:hypothetical protein
VKDQHFGIQVQKSRCEIAAMDKPARRGEAGNALWRVGKAIGASQVALKVPFTFPLAYKGSGYDFSKDLSTIVYARPEVTLTCIFRESAIEMILVMRPRPRLDQLRLGSMFHREPGTITEERISGEFWGRPRVDEETERFVVRMEKENRGWGNFGRFLVDLCSTPIWWRRA